MSANLDLQILEFVRLELSAHKLELESSLTTGRTATVPEDVYELIEKYSERFNVDCSNIEWLKYYPRTGIPFLPNFLLPKSKRTDNTEPKPLTVKMLADFARAGQWIYD